MFTLDEFSYKWIQGKMVQSYQRQLHSLEFMVLCNPWLKPFWENPPKANSMEFLITFWESTFNFERIPCLARLSISVNP